VGGENSLRYFVSQLDGSNWLNGKRANGTELGEGGTVRDRWNFNGSDCMKLLIIQFSTEGGRYRKTRAIFDWSWDNTNKHIERRKTYLAVLQSKSNK